MRAASSFGLGLLNASFALAMAGCSAAPSNDATASSGTDEALSTKTTTYVTFAASHGGYDVTDVNTAAKAHVGTIDYSRSSLDSSTIADLATVPSDELVLEGKLGSGSKSFVVTAAFRGMPGVSFVAGRNSFYQATDYSPPRECFAAPCQEGTVSTLNTTGSHGYDRIDVTSATMAFVDPAWLTRQVGSHGAIVAGVLASGSTTGVRVEKVLTARQIFVALPFVSGPCIASVPLACPAATPTRTYSRTADMCVVPQDCVVGFACPHFVPACDAGYTRTSWISDPNGCPAYACDPSFTH